MASDKKDHNRPTDSGLSPLYSTLACRTPNGGRTLAEQAMHGTLCSLALEPAGYPYGSLANFALTEDNAPLFLISDLAEHTANLKADPRSSLLIAETDPDQNPLARGRVTLLGTCRKVGTDDLEAVRERYIQRIPNARYYVDFKDFHFYRMEVEALRFIGDLGVCRGSRRSPGKHRVQTRSCPWQQASSNT